MTHRLNEVELQSSGWNLIFARCSWRVQIGSSRFPWKHANGVKTKIPSTRADVALFRRNYLGGLPRQIISVKKVCFFPWLLGK